MYAKCSRILACYTHGRILCRAHNVSALEGKDEFGFSQIEGRQVEIVQTVREWLVANGYGRKIIKPKGNCQAVIIFRDL